MSNWIAETMANLTMNTTEENSSKPLPACCQETPIDTDMKSPGAEFNLREFLLIFPTQRNIGEKKVWQGAQDFKNWTEWNQIWCV